jgi:pimeloyl-ACP methyl ester carboxylesterase
MCHYNPLLFPIFHKKIKLLHPNRVISSHYKMPDKGSFMNPAHIEVIGSGSPVILVHGSFATTSTWKGMVKQLASHHQCIMIRLPGHGGAPDPQDFDNPDINTELAVIEEAVAHYTHEPIHLIGHSFGGVVALALALKGSVAIRELTLFEPVAAWLLPHLDDTATHQKINAFVDNYKAAVNQGEPRVAGRVIDFWGESGSFANLPTHIQDGLDPLVPHNLRHWQICTSLPWTPDNVRQLDIPVRLVYGSNSNPATQAIARHIVALAPNSSLHEIAGASHMLVTSHARECVESLGFSE